MKKLTILLLLVITSCATFKEQVNGKVNQQLTTITENNLSHRFYLIGDAGNAVMNESTSPLLSLQNRLKDAPENSTVIFLGDNIYQHGLPKKEDEGYELAKHRLQVQIDAVKEFKGNRIFIPGNHDYHSEGVKGLKRQEKLVEKGLGKDTFLPENGCPITKVKLNDETALIIVDSQWYLENWDNNPTINDDCEIKTRKDFFLEFESLIKKNRTKTTIVALHHPLFTDGAHGGKFSMKQHLVPNNRLPLPILGSIANFIRKAGGVSSQDIQNKNYRHLINRLTTIAQESDRVIFASGHEHSLQHIEKNNVVQIVSGSGSKVSGVKKSAYSDFAYSALGYAILDVYKDGTTQVQYITTETEDKVAFTKEIFPAYPRAKEVVYDDNFSKEVKASVYSKEATIKSGFYQGIWGKHYREVYGIDVNVPTVNLDTLYGGLVPIKRGGGNQSVSLRLVDKKGQQWVMRALKKNAVQFLQINAYQQKYIKEDLKGTFLESFIEDVYTTSHPYAAFIMPELSKSVGVHYTKPILYYVPKQSALGVYNQDYGDALYMIEEHVGDTQVKRINFGQPDDIVSTLDMFRKLQKNTKHSIDEKAYIRARLFDMILGDWDRHQDQWRWSEFEEGGKSIYKPIPRDRDQVFATYDGLLLRLITRLVPTIRKMQPYEPEIRNLKWHNTNGMPVDITLLKTLTLEDWLVEAAAIKNGLSDEVIENAFLKFPEEVQNANLEEVKKTFKYRRDHVEAIAKAYYTILNKNVILTATNKKDKITIDRLAGGKTQIQFYRKDELYFDRIYDAKETKEIWLYALDGDDQITVKGTTNDYIKLRIIGGQNNDNYVIENGKKVWIYDYKSKKNDVTNAKKAKLRLLDEYQTNVYDYHKRKERVNQLLPLLGINKDDGFFLGVNNTLTFNNFRQNPFSHRHHINVAYYITNSGYDLNYNGEYANIFNNVNVTFGLAYTSPNYATNFFGFGNETENFEDDTNIQFNRVKVATFRTELGISKHGRQGSELRAVGVFESIRVDNTEGRFVGSSLFTPSADFFERKEFAGVETRYQFKNYNDPAYPTLGMDLNLVAGWKANLEETNRNFGYIIPSLSFIKRITSNERWVLANKTKAHFVLGDDYEFYQGASIGANDGLRGFRHQRFLGNTAFYNSTDVRFNFRKFKTGLAPMNIGFYTGFDIGRVWLDKEDSDKWHNSVGGGVWLKAAEMITGQFGVFGSSEDVRLSFGLGFGI